MLFMLGLLTNRDNALGVVCFVCSCCLLIFLMSSESQGPPERPKARPHRCNARVEDLLQALFTLEFGAKVRPAWRNVRECLKSELGQEPTQAYLCVKDPDLYLNPDRMTYRREWSHK